MFDRSGYINLEVYYYIIDFVYDVMFDGYSGLIGNFYFVVLE